MINTENFIKITKDLGYNLSRHTGMPLVIPDWVSVMLTTRCNLKCIMCKSCYKPPFELSTDEVIGIINEIADWGVKIFNPLGGEPFIRKDLIQILEHACNKGLITTVTTNATLINEKIVKSIAALQRVHLNISLDGLEKTNDLIRGKGTFKKALKAIKDIRKAEKKILGQNEKKAININCIIHEKNLDEIIELVEYVKKAGADKVQFLYLFEYENSDTDKNFNKLWIHENDFERLDDSIDELCKYILNDDSSFEYVNSIHDLQLAKKYYRHTLSYKEAPCYNGIKELYINVDGEVLMCDTKLNFLAGKCGNIRNIPLKKIWFSKQAWKRRRAIYNCKHACIQDCYRRSDADNLLPIIIGMTKELKAALPKFW